MNTLPATPTFKSNLDEILNMFNQSSLLPWTNPYADSFNSVLKYVLTHEESNSTQNPMTFGVQLMPNSQGDDYEYTLLANESCLYPIIRHKFRKIDPSVPFTEKEAQLTTAESMLEEFSSAYGSSEGYIKYIGLLRYILMHEACHVLFAHQARSESVLQKFGKSLYNEDGSVSNDQLVLYAMRVFNIIQDAFINEGLDQLRSYEQPLMAAAFKKTLLATKGVQDKLEISDVEKLYGHQFMYDGSLLDGIRSQELVKTLKEMFSKSKLTDVQNKIAHKLIEDLENNKLLDIYDEDTICEFVFSVMKDNPQIVPQSMVIEIQIGGQGQGSPQQSQSGGQGGGEGGGEGEQEGQSQGQDGKDSKDGKDAQGGQGQGEGEEQQQQQGQGARASQNNQQGQQSGQKIYGIADQNGKIHATVSPGLKGDAAKKSGEKLEGAGRRQAAELQGMMDSGNFNENMSNDDNGRGFGSVFGRCLEALNKVEFSWEDAIAAFVKSLPGIKDEKSWARKNIPYNRVGIRYPGDFLKRKPEDEYAIMLMIDTSGSMSQEEVRRMLGSIMSAVGASIQRLYVAFHDYDLTDMGKSIDSSMIQKYRKVIDKKFLEEYGVLKLELGGDDSKRTLKMLEEVIKIAAKGMACGGTSHCVPVTTMGENGTFKAIKERLSGLLMYTDCGSDLEQLPQVIDQLGVDRKVVLKDNQVRIINSERGMQYQHPRYDVIAMDKLVEAGKKQSSSKTR